jgi:hypothetical protein
VTRPAEGDPDRRFEETPPLGGRWVWLYAAGIGFLAIQILVYWLFTRAFS